MKKGFTLVETIVAATLIVTALLGIIALASYSYSIGGRSGEALLATSLAREGMEVMRAIRDSNWLALNDWNYGLSAGSFIANADSTSLTQASFSGGSTIKDCTNCGLCLSSGRYFHCPSPNTIYKRLLQITSLSPNEIRISSQVLWRTKAGDQTINLQQILTNWR
ncbi:MAG: hypothetical protein N2259_01530 [Patescibacteria group bacterium]|nr:hypothetical protein [Patescibacteria group bacterium]